MRIFLILLTFLAAGSLIAQQPFPAGVANTYLLTDKDGFNGSGYNFFASTSDGITYSAQYFNFLTIHGNNYSVVFDTLRKIPGNIQGIKIVHDKEAWVIGSSYVAVFNNTELIKIDKAPFNTDFSNSIADATGIYFFVQQPASIETWHYDGINFRKTGSTNEILTSSDFGPLTDNFGNSWFCKPTATGSEIYKIDLATGRFTSKKRIDIGKKILVNSITDENYFLYGAVEHHLSKAFLYDSGRVLPLGMNLNSGPGAENTLYSSYYTHTNTHLYKQDNEHNFIASLEGNSLVKRVPFLSSDYISSITSIRSGQYIGNANYKPFRIFPYIKKYPGLYHGNSSNNVFAVKQDARGRIWAGSYQGNLSVIDSDVIHKLPGKGFQYMNAGCYFNGNMYLVGEGLGGLIQVNEAGMAKQMIPATPTGFSALVTKNQQYLYYGTSGSNGLWQATTSSIEKLQPKWNKIDSSRGSAVHNILTITEDTLGRIWYGHPRRSLAMYDPVTNKAITWQIEKNETTFGSFAALTDQHGTVWIASGTRGLWYYNDYKKPANPQSFKRVIHAFLQDKNLLTGLTIYKDWLVIAATDKMLLLNIDSLFYKQKTIIRYLNPQEAAFTTSTEQNTLLTSFTDSTVWFSTSDMLYQWNVNNWLQLTTYKVQVSALVITSEHQSILQPTSKAEFEPGVNSFEIQCHYVSPDNLPRYVSALFIKDGEKIEMPAPSLESNFILKNLEAGSYTFLLDVFESDGSISHYSYPVVIKKFIWQQWWFWALVCFALSGMAVYEFDLRKRKQLAEQQMKLKEAELATFKSEQDKKLANLQLITLSSQFRPHFILNALNTIGAQMDDKPEAESVLSRLGESVNLIFNHAQQQRILHPFVNEWSLVKNVIHIHTLMYLKALQVNLPGDKIIEKLKDIQVPLGILQIPVENALLHGLSNNENGPWNLTIGVSENELFILIEITDNGVGRKKSASLSNYTKHGTGTKNQQEIIQIINAANYNKIAVVYTDDIFGKDVEAHGTSVLIKIPKQLHYGN